MITLNNNGIPLTVTEENVTMPADYSFTCINDFVHSHGTSFEDLQYLCLGMANEIERLKKSYCLTEAIAKDIASKQNLQT